MQQSTLLDATQRASGSPTPDTSAAMESADDRRRLDGMIAALIPCRNDDPELWFAEQTARVEQAKALCRQCPILDACLTGALERSEPWGVWGGEVFVSGVVVATKRGRGRPRKGISPAA